MKIYGQGAWHVQKHGEKQHKRWKKLHIGVDAQGQIVAATVTESQAQDPAQVPTLLAQVHHPIECFIGDGMYDKEPVYAAVAQYAPGVRVIIPPRTDAVVSPMAATAPTQRDQQLLAIKSEGRCPWKRRSGYYAQSQAENAFSRYKRMFGGTLQSKRDASQEREAPLACELLNRLRALSRPQSYAVG